MARPAPMTCPGCAAWPPPGLGSCWSPPPTATTAGRSPGWPGWSGRRPGLRARGAITAAAAAAIAAEGAEVVTVPGSYDKAVAAAAGWVPGQRAQALVQDTAWPGYEQVPGWIVEGYDTLFAELDGQLDGGRAGPPSLVVVVVPVGVGSLAQAAVAHYRGDGRGAGTALLAVEPDTAAWVVPSLIRGEPVSVVTGETIMAGLNCGRRRPAPRRAGPAPPQPSCCSAPRAAPPTHRSRPT